MALGWVTDDFSDCWLGSRIRELWLHVFGVLVCIVGLGVGGVRIGLGLESEGLGS